MNDLSVLNRMLTVKFELRIYWYTNMGQMSNTAPNVMMCHSNPQTSGRICSVHEMIFNNQSAAQRDRVGDSLSCALKA